MITSMFCDCYDYMETRFKSRGNVSNDFLFFSLQKTEREQRAFYANMRSLKKYAEIKVSLRTLNFDNT